MLKKYNLNAKESLEVVGQNASMIDVLLNARLLSSNSGHSFSNMIKQFNSGQWIDAKDTIDQWLEAQITKLRDNKAFVHYNGWGSRWDEWIDLNSPRLALFRTHTIQLPSSSYLSPSPNIPSDAENHEITVSNVRLQDMICKLCIYLISYFP